MRRAPTAPHGSPATMKQSQLNSVFPRRFMQSAMRLVYLPSARQHSAILIRIGIPKHHFLPSAPTLHQLRVLAITPERPHHFRRTPQRLDRLEQWYRHHSCILLRSLYTHFRCPRQPDHRHDVFHALRAAHDKARITSPPCLDFSSPIARIVSINSRDSFERSIPLNPSAISSTAFAWTRAC